MHEYTNQPNLSIPTQNLTVKQTELVRNYLLQGEDNKAEAARKAGYSVHTARQIGHETLNKPHVMEAMIETKRLVAEQLQIDFKERIAKNLEVYSLATERDDKNAPRDLSTAQRVNEHLANVFGDLAPKETKSTNHNVNLTAIALVEKYRKDY